MRISFCDGKGNSNGSSRYKKIYPSSKNFRQQPCGNAKSIIRKYLTVDKAVTLMHLYYQTLIICPIIWMFCRKSANVVINKAHKKALRVVYNKPQHTLDELLKLNKGSTIHAKNLRTLMCEIYKCLHEQNPEFMWELIKKKDNIRGLRASNILHLPSRHTKSKGTNTLLYHATSLWNTLPREIMAAKSLPIFKGLVNKWTGIHCICDICKT